MGLPYRRASPPIRPGTWIARTPVTITTATLGWHDGQRKCEESRHGWDEWQLRRRRIVIIPESGPTAAYPSGGDASAEAGSTVFRTFDHSERKRVHGRDGQPVVIGQRHHGQHFDQRKRDADIGDREGQRQHLRCRQRQCDVERRLVHHRERLQRGRHSHHNDERGHVYGIKHAGTVWPTSPSPCAGSYVTCDPSGKGLVERHFPSNPFPSLTASNFSGYSVWADPDQHKTYPSGCSSNVNSSVANTENSSKYSSAYANYRPAVGDATYAVYHEIETATTPTVVETPCAFEWDDSATNGAITINANVAVLAQGGFTTGGDWANPGVLGQYSSSTYQLYMVVPYSGSGAYPVNGEPIADLSSCPESTSQPPNVYQYATGNYYPRVTSG